MSGDYGFRSGGVLSGSAGRFDSDLTVIGSGSVSGDLTITGDLTVNGTTTTVNSTTVTVDDKNIELGSTASPSDASADGGGLTLKGDTDKTFNWVDANDAWTSSEHMDLASGKKYMIDGSQIDTDDILEGSNQFYTNARARDAVSVTDAGGDGSLAYNSSTGVITYTGPSSAEVRAHLSNGNMLDYSAGEFAVNASSFTSSARDTVSVTDAGGDGSLAYDSSTGVITYTGPSSSEVRAHLSNGNMLDYSAGEFAVNASSFTSSARDTVSVTDNGGDGALSYDSSTGVISYTGPSSAEVRAHLSATDGIDYSAGVFTLASSVAGTGLSYDGGVLSVDAAESEAGTIDVGADSFQFIDATDGETRKESVADLMTAVAGDGLSASSGSLAVIVDDSSIEIDADTLQIKSEGVTNSMLFGGIENEKLSNSSITIGGDSISLGDSITDIDLNGGGALILDADGTTKIWSNANDMITFQGATGKGLKMDTQDGANSLVPLTAGMDLGSSEKYFSNIYTGDMHLRNERGDWTIFEESDHLRIRNNLTGQTYKMGMTLINE